MSRGSTLTLYKKYDLKMDDKTFDTIVRKYAKENRSHDFSEEKKAIEEYSKDLPKIMSIHPFAKETRYDKKTNSWIDITPKKTITNLCKRVVDNVDRDDHNYCSKLMEWNFCSSFDCLVEHFGIARYTFKDSVVEITPHMARQMLEAINYLLGGKWDDSIANAMNNPYICIFSEGGNCYSYWKYIYRNKNNTKKKTFRINKDGYDITIKCPVANRKSKDTDDCDYDYDIDEGNSDIEYYLDTFRSGLIAFLKSDNWERHDDDKNIDGWLGYDNRNNYKYVLTYEYWG